MKKASMIFLSWKTKNTTMIRIQTPLNDLSHLHRSELSYFLKTKSSSLPLRNLLLVISNKTLSYVLRPLQHNFLNVTSILEVDAKLKKQKICKMIFQICRFETTCHELTILSDEIRPGIITKGNKVITSE